MIKTGAMVVLLVGSLAACGSHGNREERWAVGTYLYSGDVMFGATDCTFDAPAGVLDGTMVKAPGKITEKCPKGNTATIVADYADHIALTFPKTVKVGDHVAFSFELRDAQNRRLTPTLSEMDVAKLEDGCTALTDLGRGGAQDTGHDPFMSATASKAGQCKVSTEIELPVAGGGTKKHQAEQVVVVK